MTIRIFYDEIMYANQTKHKYTKPVHSSQGQKDKLPEYRESAAYMAPDGTSYRGFSAKFRRLAL
jgi:hypothetical protein